MCPFLGINRDQALERPILYSNWLSKDYVPVNRDQLREYVKARLKVRYQDIRPLIGLYHFLPPINEYNFYELLNRYTSLFYGKSKLWRRSYKATDLPFEKWLEMIFECCQLPPFSKEFYTNIVSVWCVIDIRFFPRYSTKKSWTYLWCYSTRC